MYIYIYREFWGRHWLNTEVSLIDRNMYHCKQEPGAEFKFNVSGKDLASILVIYAAKTSIFHWLMLPGGISHPPHFKGKEWSHTWPARARLECPAGTVMSRRQHRILVAFSFLKRFGIDRRQKRWCVVFTSHNFGYLASYPGALHSL